MGSEDLMRAVMRRANVVLIDDVYGKPESILAAMLAAANRAAALVAEGLEWEGDESILIPPAAKPHALRMAAIWQRAADHLQGGERSVSRGERSPDRTAPARSARAGSDGARPAR